VLYKQKCDLNYKAMQFIRSNVDNVLAWSL